MPGAAGRLKTAHPARRPIVTEHMFEQRTRSPGRCREVVCAVHRLEAARHDSVRGVLAVMGIHMADLPTRWRWQVAVAPPFGGRGATATDGSRAVEVALPLVPLVPLTA